MTDLIVVAIPTIEERGEAWEQVGEVWKAKTRHPVLIVPSWRKGGWAQGLNEVWEAHSDAEVFITASDDMTPNPGWYEAIEPYLSTGVIAPQMFNHYPDPNHNWNRFGPEVIDGQEVEMSSLPILAQRVAKQVFPLAPEVPQHYFADNYISDLARVAGFPTVAVPSCVITHTMDMRGRGAGMGDESTRMAHDREIYRRINTHT